jgi:osmotically-inducible protein OsmY
MIRSSEQIKQNVINHLCWDDRVDASDIKVEASGNKVTLSGIVPTYNARKAALDDALFVAGVNSVENNIEVHYPAEVPVPSNVEVKTNIENSLIWNQSVDSSNIKITVNHGKVTLEGFVDSFWRKTRVEELVSGITGVVSVKNMLAVGPLKNALDEKITEEIIAALNRMGHVNADRVNVEVDNGKVTLSGKVSDWLSYYSAYDAVRYTRDVVYVVNNLIVEQNQVMIGYE